MSSDATRAKITVDIDAVLRYTLRHTYVYDVKRWHPHDGKFLCDWWYIHGYSKQGEKEKENVPP